MRVLKVNEAKLTFRNASNQQRFCMRTCKTTKNSRGDPLLGLPGEF